MEAIAETGELAGGVLSTFANRLGVEIGNGDLALRELVDFPETEKLREQVERLEAFLASLGDKKPNKQTLRELEAKRFRLAQGQRRDALVAARRALGAAYLDCWCLGLGGKRPVALTVTLADGTRSAVHPDGTPRVTYFLTCPCPDGIEAARRSDLDRAELRESVEKQRMSRMTDEARIPPLYRGMTVSSWVEAAIRNGGNEDEIAAVELALDDWYDAAVHGEYEPGSTDDDGHLITPPQSVLMLAGRYGTGKSALAAAIAQRALIDGTSVLFRTPAEIYSELRAAPWRARADDETPTEIALITLMQNVGLLVIDDWGNEAITEASEQKMLEQFNQVIEHRLRNLLPTIYTTNLDGKTLTQRVGERIMQRVKPTSISAKIVLDTPDLRGAGRG